MYYDIKQDRRRRSNTFQTHVVITHMNNLILKENKFDDRNILKGSYKYSWGKVQNYLIRHANIRALPMHYFVELIDKDYVVIEALSDYKPSYYLQELADKGIIPQKYRNSILIAISDDFSLYNPETRMFKHLSDKLLIPLAKRHRLSFHEIKLIDEIYSDDYIDKLNTNRFETKSMIKFDKQRLKNQFNMYNVMK
ncbi:hypothetical protein [Staphylococcus phage vB_StaM_PB50]|nr:hypothetical protein [Staphylococcus phage vB_StaM_PB50]